jgi:hypothetical protein
MARVHAKRWPARYVPNPLLLVTAAAAAEQLLPTLLRVSRGERVLDSIAEYLQRRTEHADSWYVGDPDKATDRFRFNIAGRCGRFNIQDIDVRRGCFTVYRKGEWLLMSSAVTVDSWYWSLGYDAVFEPVELSTLLAVGEAVSAFMFGAAVRRPHGCSQIVAAPSPKGGEIDYASKDHQRYFAFAEHLLFLVAMVRSYGPIDWDADWCARWGFDPSARVDSPFEPDGSLRDRSAVR